MAKTKDELQQEVERLTMLLGLAFMLIPAAKTHIFFEKAKELKKGL
jgi:hypothetical protein